MIDIPIIIPCVKYGLTLATLNGILRRLAGELIRVISLKESIKEMSRST
jgi:hypothetical protein